MDPKHDLALQQFQYSKTSLKLSTKSFYPNRQLLFLRNYTHQLSIKARHIVYPKTEEKRDL